MGPLDATASATANLSATTALPGLAPSRTARQANEPPDTASVEVRPLVSSSDAVLRVVHDAVEAQRPPVAASDSSSKTSTAAVVESSSSDAPAGGVDVLA